MDKRLRVGLIQRSRNYLCPNARQRFAASFSYPPFREARTHFPVVHEAIDLISGMIQKKYTRNGVPCYNTERKRGRRRGRGDG